MMPGPVPHGTLHAAHGAHGTQIPAPMVPAALAVPLAPGAVHGLPQAAGRALPLLCLQGKSDFCLGMQIPY